MQHTLLPKRVALPVFASDALSSVAYAPDEILMTLSVGGAAFYAYSPWIALCVVVVMLTVVASYRQNVHAYPSGGGDYEVATVNLGPRFGLVVASAVLVDFGFAFLMVRTFASGSTALTGVEAISNGVPAFRPPKSRNAATTLLMLGLIAVTMLVGIVTLTRLTQLKMVEPGHPLPKGYTQQPVLPQLAQAVFGSFHPAFYLVIATTALILVLAANTAFNGFPVLGSILAQDRYLPRQLHTRGDRLAFSNGILFLAAFAIVLIVAFQATATRLIQLYIVGVFVSFTLSQTGMLRHWNRLLRTERDPAIRRRMYRSRTINAVGLCMTGFVLVLVVVTKF